jgi:Mrp family chromosome partitioning ATPase
MRRLSEQRVTLRAQLAEQSSTLLDQHPRIKELKAQIADLDREIRSEADRLARSLENDARVASAKLDSLGASLDQLKRQAASTNEQDVQLRALEREAKAQRELLESYLAKYREATTRDSIGAGSPDARIISTAIVSNTPSWPKKAPTVLIAALGTLVLTVAFIVSGQLLSGQLAAPVGVGAEGSTEFPEAPELVATEPDAASVEPATASHPTAPAELPAPETGASVGAGTAFGALTGRLMGRIAVIAAHPAIDTTAVAVVLARELAGRGKAVLLDLVFGGTGLCALGADPSMPGISDLVLGAASFGDIIARDRHSGTHFVTAGRAAVDVTSAVQSPRLVITVEALARSYDHVVINAGALPELPIEAIVALAPQALLVADRLDETATKSAEVRLVAAGCSTVSVVPSVPPPDGASARAAA